MKSLVQKTVNYFRVKVTPILIISLFLFLSHQNVYTQQDYKFDHIGYESGLPDGFSINYILQDELGFLWFGSLNRLVKYDGYKMKFYEHNDKDSTSLIVGSIRTIFLDNDNNLWVASDNGLSKYNRENDKFINYYLFSDYCYCISNIAEDSSGVLWISTNYNGLVSFNKNTKEEKLYKHEEGSENSICSDSLASVLTDDYNNLWISTKGYGLDKFDVNNKQFTHFRHSKYNTNSIGSDVTYRLYKDRWGIIWIELDSNRIDELNPENGKFNHYTLDIDFSVTSFYRDKSGFLWITTGIASNSIILFDKNNSSCFLIKNDPLNPQSILSGSTSIYEDRSGVIWVGTTGNGLCKYVNQKQKFKHYKNELNPARVWSITGDSSNIWIGTKNGLDKYDPLTGKYTHYSNETGNSNSLSDDDVRKLIIDKTGILWIGTYRGGLNKFDIKRNKFTWYKHNPLDFNSISDGNFSDICEDSFGDLWIGTDFWGLDKFDRKNLTFKHHKNISDDSSSLGSNNVKVIYEDMDKTLWIGSGSKGLSRYNRDNGTFKEFYDKQSINKISGIYEDIKKRFWVTSFATGLNLFDRNTGMAKTYNENNGLLSNFIVGILGDISGKIWLSTRRGLSCFNPENESFRNYDKEDGLKVTNFYLNAAYKSKDGTLYLGGDGGIISFKPDSVITNPHVPDIVLTDFKIFNQSVSASENSPLKKHINVAEEINFSYKDNSISFEFTALDFNNPSRNQYAYIMEGFDKDWVLSGNVRTAYYTNLDPGEYTFRVKGSNSDGVWNEKGASIKVIISPPWWKTWWFRGCGVILILGILGYTRQRQLTKIRKEIRQKEEFARQLIESQEQERKRIAGDLHDSLAQNLLVTKNRVSLLERKKNIGNEIKNELIEINEGILGSLDEIRTITYSLRPHEIDRFGLTDSTKQLIEKVRESVDIDFTFQSDNIDNILKQEDGVILYRIIQECLNNILKHSGAKKAEVKIKKLPDSINISIKDNGKGFDATKLETQSKSFGIKGLRERVNLLKGSIDIITVAGKGTEIQIIIPVFRNG